MYQLQTTLIVVFFSCWSENTSIDMVCHEQEGIIPGGAIANGGMAASRY